MKEKLTTPVLFIVFNRPDTTLKVFNAIRKAKPEKLFISADGPRKNKADDVEQCAKARGIIDMIDWDCEVHCNFNETNLGCKIAASSAINWFFDNVDEGIILEDDCLPSQSFFWFCQELLKRYRDDERIMQISGNNFLFGKHKSPDSYYFSKLNDIWGWATWRRAWKYFDIDMKGFVRAKEEKQLKSYLYNDKRISRWLMSYFEESCGKDSSVWSSQWSYAIYKQNGLTIVPNVNLVLNLGFEKDSTHAAADSWRLYADADICEIDQIAHPKFIIAGEKADKFRFKIIQKTDPRLIINQRLKFFVNRILKKYEYLLR